MATLRLAGTQVSLARHKRHPASIGWYPGAWSQLCPSAQISVAFVPGHFPGVEVAVKPADPRPADQRERAIGRAAAIQRRWSYLEFLRLESRQIKPECEPNGAECAGQPRGQGSLGGVRLTSSAEARRGCSVQSVSGSTGAEEASSESQPDLEGKGGRDPRP